MAFIRRVRTASGATAVQVAEYVGGRKQRIIAHLGSAHTEAELGILLQQARVLLEEDRQGVLDLGLEPAPPRTALLSQRPDPALFETAPAPAAPATTETTGPGRVTGTSSRLLFDALAGVYDSLGFDALGDEVFRDLVIARVVEPTSLADASRVLQDLGQEPASYATMRRTLRRAADGRYRDQAADLCCAHAVTSSDVSLVLYEVTTLYFEAPKEDTLRRVGYSRAAR